MLVTWTGRHDTWSEAPPPESVDALFLYRVTGHTLAGCQLQQRRHLAHRDAIDPEPLDDKAELFQFPLRLLDQRDLVIIERHGRSKPPWPKGRWSLF